jgi:uncharacterized membrane protein YqjE
MTRLETKRSEGSIAAVIQTLSDDLIVLFREHLRLFRVELKQDATIAARYAAAMIVFGVVALVGFLLLNLTAILFAGWAFGLAGMAVSSAVLCLIHLGFGMRAFLHVAQRLKEDELGPRTASNELQRSRTWATKLPKQPS